MCGSPWKTWALLLIETAGVSERVPMSSPEAKGDTMIPLPKPRAMFARGSNRANDQAHKQMATLMQVTHDTATRVLDLTEKVAALLQRTEELEARE